jgi:hypothetical protein
MFWINFLHFYQPANISKEIIKEATEKSYKRIIRGLEENPEIKFTFNISGCLLTRLGEDLGQQDLISRTKNLLEHGQIELTGSVAYHPILPLIGEEEIKTQIKENEEILKKYFGQIKLNGFFCPEMAYDRRAGKIIKKLGYKWIILDEISAGGKPINFSQKYIDQETELAVIFRNRKISQTYVPETILKLKDDKKESLSSTTIEDKILITATDAELYGLRHIDEPADFEKVLQLKKLKTLTISEYLNSREETQNTSHAFGADSGRECLNSLTIKLIPASWGSTEKEIKNQTPFILWRDKKNKLQIKLWELARLAESANKKFKRDSNFWWSRWHLVRGLTSCNFWWASGKDFRKVYGPLAWNPDLIELGANELIRSVRDLEKSTPLKLKLKTEKIYLEIIKLIWEKHWKKYDK